MTAKPLLNKRVLAFVGDIYEDLELWYPRLRLLEAGAKFVMAGEEANRNCQFSARAWRRSRRAAAAASA